nr:class I SAM-dependent methyltransferase [Lachnospiraceae bacterium]
EQVEKGEADAVVIAGMGGKLIMQILEASMDKVCALQELILQPQSELEFVRAFLREKNLHILQENMVEEDGKYYQILKVSPLTAVHNQTLPLSRETQDLFGPCLLLDKNPELVRFLRYREQITLKILSQMQAEGAGEKDRDRMQQLLSCIREALEYVEA